MSEIMEETISFEEETPVNQEVEKKDYPPVKESEGEVTRITKQDKGATTYYLLTIDGEYYTKWINKDWEASLMASIQSGDNVKFTYSEKLVGDKTFKNIRYMKKESGNTQIGGFKPKPKADVDWDAINKKKTDGFTYGMAMNNAAVIFAAIANKKKDPTAWVEESIGSEDWKSIEKKLYKNYVEQRTEMLGE